MTAVIAAAEGALEWSQSSETMHDCLLVVDTCWWSGRQDGGRPWQDHIGVKDQGVCQARAGYLNAGLLIGCAPYRTTPHEG